MYKERKQIIIEVLHYNVLKIAIVLQRMIMKKKQLMSLIVRPRMMTILKYVGKDLK
jgi:hypothetical protein